MWDLPAGFVWGVQAEWRRTCGTWCRDLGRQARGRRIRSTTAASSISAITRRRLPQRGHASRAEVPRADAVGELMNRVAAPAARISNDWSACGDPAYPQGLERPCAVTQE